MGKAIGSYTNCCRIQFLIFFFLLFFDTALLSDDIPIPVNPVEPSVDIASFESFNQVQDINVSASISIQGIGEKKHVVIFPKTASVVEIFSGDFPGKRDVKLEDIFSFEITRWSGNKEKDTLVERAILVNGIGTTIIPPRENLDYNAIQNLKLSYISLMEPNVIILLVNELDAKSLLKEDKEIVEKLKIGYPVIISSYESIIASYGV